MKKAALPSAESPNQDTHVSYERLLNITPLPIVIHTRGVLVYANKYALKLIGAKSKKDVIGQSVMRFIHPDFVEIVKERMAAIYSKGKQFTDVIYERLIRLDGSIIDVEIVSLRIMFKGELSVLITLQNITEHKASERILRESNSALETIIQSSPLAIYVLNGDGIVTMWNKVSEEIFGWKEDEVVGKILPIAQQDRFWEFQELMALLHQGKSFTRDLVRQRKDGSLIDVNVSATPLLDADGKLQTIVAIASDITERKELERKKDEFLGIASHELKTPVTSIKAYGQVLQTIFKRKGDTKAVELLGKMDAQVNKLTNLIGDLLDVTKIQAGKLQFEQEEYMFHALVEEIVGELQHTTERHTIKIRSNKPVTVFGDRERTGQVITNLLSNAIKYSPYADTIEVATEIATEIAPECVTLSVRDSGVGIPEDNKDKVFEQFFRVSGPRKETFPGLGLGLYISSEIIKRQGGKIWVESTEGKGSTFYFSLPLTAYFSYQPLDSIAQEGAKH